MKSVIGILGGMGPRATVAFERMLLDRLTGSDQDLPTIVTINDGSIPDRTAFLLDRGTDPWPRLQANLALLEQLGATVVCLPCITACAPAIFERLQTDRAHIIDLPAVTTSYMAERGCQRVFLLATAGTIAAGTYQHALAQKGIDCIVPKSGQQQIVNLLIRAVKKGDQQTARILAVKLRRAAHAELCDSVLLGCTELPLVQRWLVPATCEAIDTLAVLADVAVSYTQKTPIGERP